MASKKPRLSGASLLAVTGFDGLGYLQAAAVCSQEGLMVKALRVAGKLDDDIRAVFDSLLVLLVRLSAIKFTNILNRAEPNDFALLAKSAVDHIASLVKVDVRFPTTQHHFSKWVFSLLSVSGANQALSKNGPLILLGKENA